MRDLVSVGRVDTVVYRFPTIPDRAGLHGGRGQ